MRVFFARELDTAASFWRIYRRDGVTLGFTSHDRDLFFDGIEHKAAPGMTPSAIRKTADFDDESAGVEGALTHDSISAEDIGAGAFDNAAIEIGIVDWESVEHHILYLGSLGNIDDNGLGFSAELHSNKRILDHDVVPRTSPTCRAIFCGPGCGLSSTRFTHRAIVDAFDFDRNRAAIQGIDASDFIDGELRFLEGPQTGIPIAILGAEDDWLILDRSLDPRLMAGVGAEMREGCDHTFQTCSTRFANSLNFRGEPFLPGNDLLARYGQTSG